MANSIRHQIMAALITLMKTITTANGYTINLGNSVKEWRLTSIEQDDLPFMVVRDVNDVMPEVSTAGRRDHQLEVEIDIFFKGSTSARDARNIVADVAKAIGTDETLGGLAYNTEIASAALELEQTDKIYSAAQVAAVIEYRTDRWVL